MDSILKNKIDSKEILKSTVSDEKYKKQKINNEFIIEREKPNRLHTITWITLSIVVLLILFSALSNLSEGTQLSSSGSGLSTFITNVFPYIHGITLLTFIPAMLARILLSLKRQELSDAFLSVLILMLGIILLSIVPKIITSDFTSQISTLIE